MGKVDGSDLHRLVVTQWYFNKAHTFLVLLSLAFTTKLTPLFTHTSCSVIHTINLQSILATARSTSSDERPPQIKLLDVLYPPAPSVY